MSSAIRAEPPLARGSDPAPTSEPDPGSGRAIDLLDLPWIGDLFARPATRTVLRLTMLVAAGAMVAHGLLGPARAPENLATLLAWVHWRGLVVLVLLGVGNLFCHACPFILVRDAARRLRPPRRNWPRALRTKWLAIALFVLLLFSYERFDLWAIPVMTAGLTLMYFGAAIAVDTMFRGASFCKWLCPIGQFNFVASTLSPFEVAVREPSTCRTCRTVDCIRGRRDPDDPIRITKRGCELALFLPEKVGNLDCTFCLDCVHACPHDNIGVLSRLPGDELSDPSARSGIGRPWERPDFAALIGLFTFGALLNALGMVSPVYPLLRRIAEVTGSTGETLPLAILFGAVLIVEPVVLVAAASVAAARLRGAGERATAIAMRFMPSLVPIGVAIWAAHYGFHFLTGALAVVPVLQDVVSDIGLGALAGPPWRGRFGLPTAIVVPIEHGILALGALISFGVAWRISDDGGVAPAWRGWLPWAVLVASVWIAAMWLLSQPMEMRGTFFG